MVRLHLILEIQNVHGMEAQTNDKRTKTVHTLRQIYNMQFTKEGRMGIIEIVLYKAPNPYLINGPKGGYGVV